MLGAWATATAVVATAVRPLRLRFTCAALVAAVVFLLPYAMLTIRSGNVQPYVIGMVLGALALSESRPAAAGGLMAGDRLQGLAVVPSSLIPAPQAHRVALVVRNAAPALVGDARCLDSVTLAGHHAPMVSVRVSSRRDGFRALVFPGQSFRGVLLRDATSAPHWLPAFPDVPFLNLAPADAVRIREGIAVVSYLGFAV
jgi:hypothetical protein